MASQHSKRNRRSAKAKARRRAIGLGGGAGAFLAFGLSPLASAPAAHADGLDAIIDPIINSVLSHLTDSITSFDALAGIDPSSALDLGSLALPATDAATAVPTGWETLLADFANPSSLATGAVSDAGTAAAATDSTTTFWQGLEQDWINSNLGSAHRRLTNSWAAQSDPAALGSSCGFDLQRRRRHRAQRPMVETAGCCFGRRRHRL